jgi:hypothetical protein
MSEVSATAEGKSQLGWPLCLMRASLGAGAGVVNIPRHACGSLAIRVESCSLAHRTPGGVSDIM